MKPDYLLLYSGGVYSTVSLLRSVAEGKRPYLLHFHTNCPGAKGELGAVHYYAAYYACEVRVIKLDVSTPLEFALYEAEALRTAYTQARLAGLNAVVLGRRTFLTDFPPPLAEHPTPRLYLPEHDATVDELREVAGYDSGAIFTRSFSCNSSFNEIACEKCSKCRERFAFFARVREH